MSLLSRLRFPRAPMFLLLASTMATAGCAHSNANQKHGTDPMTHADDAQQLAAPTTAAEMGRRFLKLIGSIESRDELNLELIRRVTGVDMPPVKPGELGTRIWSEDLGGGWRYVFSFVPASPSLQTGVGLDFWHREDRTANMSPVCELDFDFYHDALTGMGFHANPSYGEIGQLLAWEYFKTDFVISLIPQNVVAGQAGRICVKAIGTLNGR